MSKITLGIIFGGKSVEHDVSIITACQVIEAVDKRRYNIAPIYITKGGEWFSGEKLAHIETFKRNKFRDEKQAFLSPLPSFKALMPYPEGPKLFQRKNIMPEIDVAIPLVHGTNGEDGTLQGLLELADIPYVGSGVQASAIGMDKIAMKSIFSDCDLPVVDHLWFYSKKWRNRPENKIARIEESLGYPVIVKPANLGSSIGISLVDNRDKLMYAVDIASRYDRRIMVESAVENLVEINCAVLGVSAELQSSLCEQPTARKEVLSFNDKYLSGNKGGRNRKPTSQIPADLPHRTEKLIQSMAQAAFSAIDARGTARVDLLMNKETDQVYINEINTIPGSLSMNLWEKSGVKPAQLIDRLVFMAINTHKEKNKLMYAYKSNLLTVSKIKKTDK
ncbi:MAG: D-alanine--D-alanine ligase family protein [bacterium]